MKKIMLLLFLLLGILLPGCRIYSGCPDGEIEWVDVLMVNGVTYQHDFPPNNENSHLKKFQNKEIGEVKFKLAGQACSDHKLKNNDAAYINEGTKIYSMKNYRSSFRVIADGKIYQAKENPKAKTVGDIFDIQNKVNKIAIESEVTTPRYKFFTESYKDAFLEEFQRLPYQGMSSLYKKLQSVNGQNLTLRFFLKDGTSFTILYWMEKNIIEPGAYTTAKLKSYVQRETAE